MTSKKEKAQDEQHDLHKSHPVHEHKTHKKTSNKHKIKEEEEEKERLMDEGLQAIYGEDEIDFDKLDRNNNRLTKILFGSVIILAILAITSWAGFFVFTKFFDSSKDASFTLEINIEEELKSGQMTQIEIIYANPTKVPIASLELDLNLPSTFRVYSFSEEPTNLDDLTWQIGSFSPDTDGKITIEGIWVAAVPSESPVQVYANYKPANFNSNFEEFSVAYVTTIESVLTTAIEGPEDALTGEVVNYTISIENTGEEPFENIGTALELPEGFYLEDSDPAIEAGSPAEWTIEYLDKQEISEITFSGRFASSVEGFQYFEVETTVESQTSDIEQSESSAFTDVLNNDIEIQIVANGTSNHSAVEPNGNLRISVGIENTQEETINDLSLLLDFQSDYSIPINWSDATLDGGLITRDGIIWDIDSLEPGEQVLINSTYSMSEDLGVGDADEFQIIAFATYGDHTVFSPPMAVAVNSQADLSSTVRYYQESGMELGTGPLPPEVGETTTYRVIWNIQNSLHDLNDVDIIATLPPYVSWTGDTDTDSGTIIFDESDNTVSWNISSLSSELSSVDGSFSISITPDEDDIGSFVKLLSGSALTATDAKTTEILTSSTASHTTDLQDDIYASYEGGVVIE